MEWAMVGCGFVVGFFLGSFPSGVLFARWLGYGDPRKVGSANIGATNAFRLGGAGLAGLVFFVDCAKGIAASGAGELLLGQPVGAYWGAAGAVLGHVFCPWLGFSGGKGIATVLGALVWICPWGALIAGVLWALIWMVWRRASVASLVALGIGLFVCALYHKHVLWYSATWLLLLYTHRGNILRLWRGEEHTTIPHSPPTRR